MLQSSPYPWKRLNGCQCRKFCSFMPRTGEHLWIRCQTAFGVLTELVDPKRIDSIAGPVTCYWEGQGNFVVSGETFTWGYALRLDASNVHGSVLTWQMNFGCLAQIPPPADFLAVQVVNDVVPIDCRSVPNFVLAPQNWNPGFGFPLSGFGGPLETMWGSAGMSPF